MRVTGSAAGACRRPRPPAPRPGRSRRCRRGDPRGRLASGCDGGRPPSRRRPGIDCVEQRRGGPVQLHEGEAERPVQRVLDRRLRHPGPRLDGPAGPTSTKSWASSAPVAGSHSIGGTRTASPLRIPRIRFSVSAVMNAPTTGPKDRLYGNVIVLDEARQRLILRMSPSARRATASLSSVDPAGAIRRGLRPHGPGGRRSHGSGADDPDVLVGRAAAPPTSRIDGWDVRRSR